MMLFFFDITAIAFLTVISMSEVASHIEFQHTRFHETCPENGILPKGIPPMADCGMRLAVMSNLD